LSGPKVVQGYATSAHVAFQISKCLFVTRRLKTDAICLKITVIL
jgi:hypothetical protein